MGTWNTAINGNDTFQDIYQNFFELYNKGQNPFDISRQIREGFGDMFADQDEKNDSLFGLAMAQWETKSLEQELFKQVKQIIDSGNDLEVWKGLGADDKTLVKRKVVLEKFLKQISTEREKPKRRVKPKFEFTSKSLVKVVAPDNKKVFEIMELFTNGIYQQTGSSILWATGGGGILYFTGQGHDISARWIDSQTLEVTHDKAIVFTKQETKFFYCGDAGVIIYKSK